MKLADYLEKDLVLADLKAEGKEAVITEMIAPIALVHKDVDAEQAFSVLMERESLGTTGIGEGIAIPHGKLESLDKIVVAVGRSIQGVDFEALDFSDCHIFFLVLAPAQVAGLHLRLLAHISRLLKDEDFRKRFLEADGPDALWDVLKSV